MVRDSQQCEVWLLKSVFRFITCRPRSKACRVEAENPRPQQGGGGGGASAGAADLRVIQRRPDAALSVCQRGAQCRPQLRLELRLPHSRRRQQFLPTFRALARQKQFRYYVTCVQTDQHALPTSSQL